MKLVVDSTESITVPANSELTLDLNGCELTNVAGGHTITNNGTLTITDSSANHTGTVDNVSHQCGALVNSGTVTLNGGKISRSKDAGTGPKDSGGNSWYTIKNSGSGAFMTICEGTEVYNAGGYSSNIINEKGAALTISGGKLAGGVNTVKNDDDAGALTITGGEFSNTTQYAIMNWSTATISGGTFEVNNTAPAVLFSSAWNGSKGNLSVSGGTFNAPSNVPMIRNAYDEKNVGTVLVSGRSFSAAIPDDCCADGLAPAEQADGFYTVELLPEGALLLGKYKGDRKQADWVVPTSSESNRVFAGWYQDKDFATPCESSQTTGVAYPKFVKAYGDDESEGVINWIGNGLRKDYDDSYAKASMRFGYKLLTPDGATLNTSGKTGWDFDYVNSKGEEKHWSNYPKNLNTAAYANGLRTNLVLINIVAANYRALAKVTFTVSFETADGTMVTLSDNQQRQRSVYQTAEAITQSPNAIASDKEYAQGIITTFQETKE